MSLSRYILIAVSLTFIIIYGILSCLLGAQASVTPRLVSPGGRWQLVHSSLGLGPLPTTIAAPFPTINPRPSHYIDYRRLKRATPPPLRFTRDSPRKPRVSLKELVVSFRRIALEESKADAARSDAKRGRNWPGRASVRKVAAH